MDGCWKYHMIPIVADGRDNVRRREIVTLAGKRRRDSDREMERSTLVAHRASKNAKLARQTGNESNDERLELRYRGRRRLILGTLLIAGILVVIIFGSLVNRAEPNWHETPSSLTNDDESQVLVPPNPDELQPPSWSKLRTFKRGAVCADGSPCAEIGKSMLDKNGSAVDAVLAAMICNGLVNMQSMGIGGGFIMSLYERSTKRAYSLNAREVAPLESSSDMYENKSPMASKIGSLSIGVPGEIAGYWEVHQRFGKLGWAELFQPSIELCNSGYNMTKAQYDGLMVYPPNIYNDPILREMFIVDPATKQFKKPGTIIRPRKLCETMQLIADSGAPILYNGTLGKMLVDDLKERGSILRMKDLEDYRPVWSEPIETNLSNGLRLITTGLPSSGPLLAFILNVFDNFRFDSESLANVNNTIITYHRMIETWKYAYAMRTQLGDGDFVDLSEIVEKLVSKEYARFIKDEIREDRTWNDPETYGATNLGPEDHGTAHISVLAPNGDAVSVTSSINLYFGSGIVSERTGILMNSAMDDFGITSATNYFGLPAGHNNKIEPGKRSYSSKVPSIIVQEDGDVRMVIGGAGGTKITTSVSYVIARHLWMNDSIKEAMDAARIHHQIFPMEISYEYGVTRPVVEGLEKLGHKTSRYRHRGSIICAIVQMNGTIYANADYRKNGDVFGID